jgi:transketolase
MSDGELEEGSVWEAILLAPSLRVTQLIVIVDLNDFQSLGQISKFHPNFYPMFDKVIAFGWECFQVDGHDQRALFDAVQERLGNKPTMVLARTVKGKGVSYMENVPMWHYRSPNREEYEQAIRELEASQ